ncbi:MAG: DNA replication and repair protein RecF [Chlorobi bacterium]|nr:DNA replication and repair protein RecF [Chlorobiota bacterium]
MFVELLELHNVRCHRGLLIELNHSPVLLTGSNGVGKTSILEAINIAAMSKSFLPVEDAEIVTHGAEGYYIRAHIRHDIGSEIDIVIEYQCSGTKRISTSASGACSARDLIGLLPCVVLLSSQRDLFIGEPALRRLFVDRILSQSYTSYKHALWRMRAALRQRNRLLSIGQHGAELEAWTEELLASSIELITRRRSFVQQFNSILTDIIATFLPSTLIPQIEYSIPWYHHDNHLISDDPGQLADALRQYVRELLPRDIERSSTQWGPQRDVFTFMLGSNPLYAVASQGQQKIALFAVKLAETSYLHRITDRTPVLLLDDVFSDLDRTNAQLVEMSILQMSNTWQIFVTAPHRDIISSAETFQIVTLG